MLVIVSLAGCQGAKKAPNPTAGSAIGSAAQDDNNTPPPSPGSAAAPAPTPAATDDGAVAAGDAGTGSAADAVKLKGKTTRFSPKHGVPDTLREGDEAK